VNRRPLDVTYTNMMEYAHAWDIQKDIVGKLDAGEARETIMLLQHPPTYTIGSQRHHGPGQLVGYPLLMLGNQKKLDLHGYLRSLEEVIIRLLASHGIEGSRKPEYTGVWVGNLKIAAIGVKFNKCKHRRGFVTSHGFAFNIKSGIQHEGFQGIVPCGIEEYGVTSLEDCTQQTFSVEQIAKEIVPWFEEQFSFAAEWQSHSLQ
jgi:lipoyl(octanoyl) transferase